MIDLKTGTQLHTGSASNRRPGQSYTFGANYKLGYQILTADNAIQLAEAVNRAIDDGWCPSGGVAVGLSDGYEYRYTVCAQAMVRNG